MTCSSNLRPALPRVRRLLRNVSAEPSAARPSKRVLATSSPSREVPRDGYVAVKANRYPVPLIWAGEVVEVRMLAEEIWIHPPGVDPVHYARANRRTLCRHGQAAPPGPPK